MAIIDKIKSIFTLKNHNQLSNLSNRSAFSKWFGFGGFGYNHIEEERLINEGYLSNEDVFSVIDKLVQTSAAIPFCLYEKKGKEWVKVEDNNNSLYSLLSKPNEDQTNKEYRIEQYTNYLLTGDSFELKDTALGFTVPTSLYILPSQFMECSTVTNQRFFERPSSYIFSYGGYRTEYEAEQLIHSKKLDPSYPQDRKGLSMLQPSYLALDTSNQVHKAESAMIENRGATGMISSDSKEGYPMTAEERDELDNQLKNRIGGANNYNKTVTTSQNVKFTQLGSNLKDLMLDQIDLNKLRKFCNIYGMSSQLFNDPANKTFNNLAEAKKSLYTESAIPLAQTFVDNWNENLIPIFNDRDNKEYYIKLDTEKIEVLQKDKKMEAEKSKIMIEAILPLAEKVSLGILERNSAIQILIYTYKVTEEEAELLIPQPQETQNIQDNEQ